MNNDEKFNIIYIDYNLDEFDYLKEYKKLIKYDSERFDSKKNNYVMIDEVQMCNDFEKGKILFLIKKISAF